MQPVLVHRLRQPPCSFHRGRKVHSVPHLGGHHSKRDCKMSLAHSGRSQKDHAPALVNKPPGGQLLHQSAINTGLSCPVEFLQSFQVWKAGELNVQLDRPAMPLAELSFEQVAQEMRITPALGCRSLTGLIQMRQRYLHAQLLQPSTRLLFVGCAHWATSS